MIDANSLRCAINEWAINATAITVVQSVQLYSEILKKTTKLLSL